MVLVAKVVLGVLHVAMLKFIPHPIRVCPDEFATLAAIDEVLVVSLHVF